MAAQHVLESARTRAVCVRELGGMGRRANQASARRDRVQAYLEMSAPEDVISWTMRMRLRDSHDSQTSVSTLERYARAPVSMIRTRAAGSDVTTVACKADLKSASARKATGTSSDEAGTSSDKGCGHWNLRCKGLPRPAPTSHGSASSTQAPSSCRAGVNRAAHRAAPMAACRPAADRGRAASNRTGIGQNALNISIN